MEKSSFDFTSIGKKIKESFSSFSLPSKSSSVPSGKKSSGASTNFLSKIASSIIGTLSQYSVEQEEVVGVDITPNSVRLVQLSKANEKWTVEKLAYRHIDRVDDIKQSSTKISEEIQIAIKAGRFTTTNAAISLPVSSSIVKVIPMPLMSEDEMKKAIEYDSLWENLTQLPDALSEYSIFYQIIRKDSAANMMDVLFVASKLSDVNNYVEIVSKAGLNPIVLDVRCFALRNAFETKEMSKVTDKPLAILEMGGYENYLLILKDETPYVSDIFVSGKDKEIIGSEQNGKISLTPIVDRYIMQIRQNLSAYTTRFKTEKIENLFIVSQSPNIEGITDLLSKKLKDITVMSFDPFNQMAVPAHIKETIAVDEYPSGFTTVVGLATRKLDIFGYYKKVTGVKNINLLPNREGIKKSQRTKFVSGIAMFIIGATILISGIVLGVNFVSESSENETELTNYETLQTEVNALQMKLAKLTNENIDLITGLQLSETATTNQITAAKVLWDIADAAGVNVALSKVIFDGLNGYTLNGQALSDTDVINYISRIRENPIFLSITLEKSFIADLASEIKSFIIQIKIKPELMNAKTITDWVDWTVEVDIDEEDPLGSSED